MEHTLSNNQDFEIEIDIRQLLLALLKKWWFLLIGCCIGGVSTFAILTYAITPEYKANAVLYVLSTSTSVTSFADIQIGNALAEDFLFISKSRPTIDRTIDRVYQETGQLLTRQQILQKLSVSSAGTRMINIAVTSTDPELASIIANAVARAAIGRIEEVTLSAPPTVVEVAEVPRLPIHHRFGPMMGAMAGLVLFGMVEVVRFILNDHIKTEDDVKRYLGVPVLAVIPLGEK